MYPGWRTGVSHRSRMEGHTRNLKEKGEMAKAVQTPLPSVTCPITSWLNFQLQPLEHNGLCRHAQLSVPSNSKFIYILYMFICFTNCLLVAGPSRSKREMEFEPQTPLIPSLALNMRRKSSLSACHSPDLFDFCTKTISLVAGSTPPPPRANRHRSEPVTMGTANDSP